MIPGAVLSLLENLLLSTHNCLSPASHPSSQPAPRTHPWLSHHPQCQLPKWNCISASRNILCSSSIPHSGLIILVFAFPLLNLSPWFHSFLSLGLSTMSQSSATFSLHTHTHTHTHRAISVPSYFMPVWQNPISTLISRPSQSVNEIPELPDRW